MGELPSAPVQMPRKPRVTSGSLGTQPIAEPQRCNAEDLGHLAWDHNLRSLVGQQAKLRRLTAYRGEICQQQFG
jgi:hypothetical protein